MKIKLLFTRLLVSILTPALMCTHAIVFTSAEPKTALSPSPSEITFGGKQYERTLLDEFDFFDDTKWACLEDDNRHEYHHEWRPSCVDVRDGNLVVTCQMDGETPISGGVRSTGEYEQTYGLYHFNFKMEKADALWYAFWLLTDNMAEGTFIGNGARDGAELDMVEFIPGAEEYQLSVHWDSYDEKYIQHYSTPVNYLDDSLYEGYHDLWYLWDEHGYKLYLDGTDEDHLIYDVDGTLPEHGDGVCAVPCDIIISAEFGAWGGAIDEDQLPAHLYVNYAEVFSEKKAPVTPVTIYDAAVNETLTLAPDAVLSASGIQAALQAETAAHGVADQYLLTVTASSTPADYVYPILYGTKPGTQGWIDFDGDHSCEVDRNDVIYGAVLGSEFIAEDDVPNRLGFYADCENAVLTVSHVTIQVLRSDGSSEELSVEPSEEPSEEPIVAPAEGVVIYDAAVNETLTLAPGKRLSNADITAALQAETAAHGIAERYIVTVNGDANQTDSVYPILLGNGVEAWPSSNYDHHYKIGRSGITYGSVLGSKFTAATPPTDLYFYADTNPTTLNIDHITIRAVRKDDTVIYDSDVSETLTLAPGKRLSNADITAALQAETAAHGIAQQYIVTVTADATPAGSVYPILLGSSGAEVWPNGAGDSYHAGAGAAIIGTLAGFGFTNASDVPQALFFYAENGNTTLNIRHITIQVVRGEGSVEESTEPSGDPSDGSGGTLSEDVSEAPSAESNEDSSEKPSTEPPTETSEESSDERSEDEILYGDVDKDGEITMKDVLKLRKFIAGMIADMDRAADVNRDGSVDMKDVLWMRRLIAAAAGAPRA